MRYEARNSASVKERLSQLMAQVTAQLEAARSVAFVPDNVPIADEQDEKDSSIWSDEDVEEQDELDEIEDAQDEVEDAQDDFKDVELKSLVLLMQFE